MHLDDEYDHGIDDEEALQVRCGATMRQIGRERGDGEVVGGYPDLAAIAGFGRSADRRGRWDGVPIPSKPLPTGLSTPERADGVADAVTVGVVEAGDLRVPVRASAAAFGTRERPYRRTWLGEGPWAGRTGAFPDGGRMAFVLRAHLEVGPDGWSAVTVRGSFAVGDDGLPVAGSLAADVEVVPSRTAREAEAAAPRPVEAAVGRGAAEAADEARRSAGFVTMEDRLARIARQARQARAAGTPSPAGRPATTRAYLVRTGPGPVARAGVRRR